MRACAFFFFAMYNAIQNTWKKPMLRAHFCNNELQKPAKLWPQCLATPFIPPKKYYWRLRPTAVHSSDEKLDTCHRRVGYVNNIRAPSSCFFYAKLSSPRRLCMNVSFFARLSNLTSVYIRGKKNKKKNATPLLRPYHDRPEQPPKPRRISNEWYLALLSVRFDETLNNA